MSEEHITVEITLEPTSRRALIEQYCPGLSKLALESQPAIGTSGAPYLIPRELSDILLGLREDSGFKPWVTLRCGSDDHPRDVHAINISPEVDRIRWLYLKAHD